MRRASAAPHCATADELRAFREIATLVHVDRRAPARRADRLAPAAAAAARERGMERLAARLEHLAAGPE